MSTAELETMLLASDDESTATSTTKNNNTTITNKHTYTLSLQNSTRSENLATQHADFIALIHQQFPTTVFYSNHDGRAITPTELNTLITTRQNYQKLFFVQSRKGPADAASDIGITTMNINTSVTITGIRRDPVIAQAFRDGPLHGARLRRNHFPAKIWNTRLAGILPGISPNNIHPEELKTHYIDPYVPADLKNLPFVVCLTGVWGAKTFKKNSKMFGIQTHADKYDQVVRMMKGVMENLEKEFKRKQVITFLPGHYNKKYPEKWNQAIVTQNNTINDSWCIKTLNLHQILEGTE